MRKGNANHKNRQLEETLEKEWEFPRSGSAGEWVVKTACEVAKALD